LGLETSLYCEQGERHIFAGVVTWERSDTPHKLVFPFEMTYALSESISCFKGEQEFPHIYSLA